MIDYPRALWWLILNGIILRVRPARSAKAYRSVWTTRGSPLLTNLVDQGKALQTALNQSHETAHVEIAMRYGRPSIDAAMQQIAQRGIDKIVVLALYPQYSAATTASTFDAIAESLRRKAWLPDIRFVRDYHDHPLYIEAIVNSIRGHWAGQGQSERLLLSFHGLPRRYVLNGDPYYRQCLRTADLVAERLALKDNEWRISFQSRVGREPWLQPYTDEVLHAWGKQGVRDVSVICPGFSADCLETLEEIDEQYRNVFLQAGGRQFHYVPALNDATEHIEMMRDLVTSVRQSWT